MRRELRFKPIADEELTKLENNPAAEGILKQVRKTLGYLETNLQANSLHTHPHRSLTRRYRRNVFESYVQQNTQVLIGYFGIMGMMRRIRMASGFL